LSTSLVRALPPMQPVPFVMRTTLPLMANEPSSVRATPAPRSPPENVPDLWFTGFTNPIRGMFRELAIDARNIAKAIAAR